jgi:hypothetical protein
VANIDITAILDNKQAVGPYSIASYSWPLDFSAIVSLRETRCLESVGLRYGSDGGVILSVHERWIIVARYGKGVWDGPGCFP